MNKKLFIGLTCVLVICMVLGLAKKGNPDNKEPKTFQSSETVSESTKTKKEKTTKKHINPNDKLIALTFDDGPYSPVTDKILDTLEENGAVATFFVVGNRVEEYKSSVERASKMGCEIGSHTFSHKPLTKFPSDVIRNELKQTNDVVSKVTGKEIKIVRPPEGAVNDSVRSYIGYPLIHWSVDSKDWKYREANADYKSVMDTAFDGSIILMHDLYGSTADAVAKIVPELIADGYKFVTVSELAEARGVSLENGHSYYRFSPQETTTSSDTSTSTNSYVNIDDIVE